MANDTNCRNPTPRVYTRAAPISNRNCVGGSDPLSYIDPGDTLGKTTELIEGDQIDIQDISDSLVDRFIVSYAAFVDLNVDLTLVAKAAGVAQPSLVLFGTTVDRVELTWVYNKTTIFSQTVTNDAGITNPSLTPTDRAYDYVAQSITEDTLFTINGNDGEGKPGSNDSDAKSVSFGNYRVWGEGDRADSGSTPLATFQNFIQDLISSSGTTEITTTRVKSNLVAEGGVLKHFYYAYPKRFGFATFLQNGIPGGFKRLGNFAGTIEVAPFSSLGAGESDLLINNGLASEAFYVYQSGADNINGAVFDVI